VVDGCASAGQVRQLEGCKMENPGESRIRCQVSLRGHLGKQIVQTRMAHEQKRSDVERDVKGMWRDVDNIHLLDLREETERLVGN
jgi:hypothetical protein